MCDEDERDDEEDDIETESVVTLDPERQALRGRRTVLMLEGIDNALAKRVCEDLFMLVAQSTKPIELIISTNGGSALAMSAILDMIEYVQHCGVKVTGRVLGRAMSAGFLILQKCDRRVMSRFGYLMAHGSWGLGVGDLKDKEAVFNWEKQVRDSMARLVAERNTSKDAKYRDVEYWKELFTEDTPVFMGAQLALERGVIDEAV